MNYKEWDDRPWTTKLRDWILLWFSLSVDLRFGHVSFNLHVRTFDSHDLAVHYLALMLGFGQYRVGAVWEPLRIRLHLFDLYREFSTL